MQWNSLFIFLLSASTVPHRPALAQASPYHRRFPQAWETSCTVSRIVDHAATGIIATIETGSERAPMEAERLNQIANQLADLQHRAADLRRYL
jgi:hypothetical protein